MVEGNSKPDDEGLDSRDARLGETIENGVWQAKERLASPCHGPMARASAAEAEPSLHDYPGNMDTSKRLGVDNS